MRSKLDIIKKMDALLHLHERFICEGDAIKGVSTLEDKKKTQNRIVESFNKRSLNYFLNRSELVILNKRITEMSNEKMLRLSLSIKLAANCVLWTLNKRGKIGFEAVSSWKKRLKFGSEFDYTIFLKKNAFETRSVVEIKRKYLFYKFCWELQEIEKYHEINTKKRDKLFNKYIKKYGRDDLASYGIVINEEKRKFFIGKEVEPIGCFPQYKFLGISMCKEALEFILNSEQ